MNDFGKDGLRPSQTLCSGPGSPDQLLKQLHELCDADIRTGTFVAVAGDPLFYSARSKGFTPCLAMSVVHDDLREHIDNGGRIREIRILVIGNV